MTHPGRPRPLPAGPGTATRALRLPPRDTLRRIWQQQRPLEGSPRGPAAQKTSKSHGFLMVVNFLCGPSRVSSGPRPAHPRATLGTTKAPAEPSVGTLGGPPLPFVALADVRADLSCIRWHLRTPKWTVTFRVTFRFGGPARLPSYVAGTEPSPDLTRPPFALGNNGNNYLF